jgi:hypothetical protein
VSSGRCLAKASDGTACASDSACTSGVCAGGNCCNRNGQSFGCTGCGSNGNCQLCDSLHTLMSGKCKLTGTCCIFTPALGPTLVPVTSPIQQRTHMRTRF